MFNPIKSIKLLILTVFLIQAEVTGSRRSTAQMREAAQRAYDHGIRINQSAPCSIPRPELIYLTDRNKIYLPRATLLHRCSDSIGCCAHATQSCRVSAQEPINLYFFVISGSPHGRGRRSEKIETLTFMNHTECSCQQVDNTRLQSIQWPIIAGLDEETTNSTSGLSDIGDNSIDSRSATFDENNDVITAMGSSSLNSSIDYESLAKSVHNYWHRTVGLRLVTDRANPLPISNTDRRFDDSMIVKASTPNVRYNFKYKPIYSSYTRYLQRPLYTSLHYIPRYILYKQPKYNVPFY